MTSGLGRGLARLRISGLRATAAGGGVSRRLLSSAASGAGITRKELPSDYMRGVHKILYGKVLTGQEAVNAARAMAKADPKGYSQALASATRSVVEPVAQMHAAEFPGPAAKWSAEARSRVYQSTLECPEGGHITLIVCPEYHEDPTSLVTDPGAVNHYIQALAGTGFLLKHEHYLQLLRRMKQVDGMPDDVLAKLWPEIVKLNSDMAGKDPKGLYGQLGITSTVFAEETSLSVGDDFGNHSTSLYTTLLHILDGLAHWNRSYLKQYPDMALCSSFHHGKNPIPGYDKFNVDAIPYLFKNKDTRGTILNRMLKANTGNFTPDQIKAGLLGEDIRRSFESRLPWDVRLVSGIFGTLSVLGETAVTARLFVGPGTAASVTDTQLTNVKSEDDLNKLLDEGTARTIADGMTGAPAAPVLEPGSTDLVVPPAQTAISAPQVTSPAETPILSQFQPTIDALGVAARAISKELALAEVTKVIETNVQSAVRELPDAAQPGKLDAVLKAVDTPAVRVPAQHSLDGVVLASLASSKAVTDAAAAYGANGATALVGMQVSDPLWAQMNESASGDSFVQASIAKAAAVEVAHQLEQNIDKYAKALAAATDLAKKANDDRAARKPALDQQMSKIDDALRNKPNDPDLLKQKQELQKQLDDIEKTLTDAEAAREAAEEASDKANKDGKPAIDEANDAADRAEKQARAQQEAIAGEKVLV